MFWLLLVLILVSSSGRALSEVTPGEAEAPELPKAEGNHHVVKRQPSTGNDSAADPKESPESTSRVPPTKPSTSAPTVKATTSVVNKGVGVEMTTEPEPKVTVQQYTKKNRNSIEWEAYSGTMLIHLSDCRFPVAAVQNAVILGIYPVTFNVHTKKHEAFLNPALLVSPSMSTVRLTGRYIVKSIDWKNMMLLFSTCHRLRQALEQILFSKNLPQAPIVFYASAAILKKTQLDGFLDENAEVNLFNLRKDLRADPIKDTAKFMNNFITAMNEKADKSEKVFNTLASSALASLKQSTEPQSLSKPKPLINIEYMGWSNATTSEKAFPANPTLFHFSDCRLPFDLARDHEIMGNVSIFPMIFDVSNMKKAELLDIRLEVLFPQFGVEITAYKLRVLEPYAVRLGKIRLEINTDIEGRNFFATCSHLRSLIELIMDETLAPLPMVFYGRLNELHSSTNDKKPVPVDVWNRLLAQKNAEVNFFQVNYSSDGQAPISYKKIYENVYSGERELKYLEDFVRGMNEKVDKSDAIFDTLCSSALSSINISASSCAAGQAALVALASNASKLNNTRIRTDPRIAAAGKGKLAAIGTLAALLFICICVITVMAIMMCRMRNSDEDEEEEDDDEKGKTDQSRKAQSEAGTTTTSAWTSIQDEDQCIDNYSREDGKIHDFDDPDLRSHESSH